MKYYDIFNGDADGICALHQLRLKHPCKAELITGVKRDIKLLSKIPKTHDSQLTVLDISLASNRDELLQLLEQNNNIYYCDHHSSGDIPISNNLTADIDTSAETCTSLILNSKFNGAYALWAICGAFGDNLHGPAQKLCHELGAGNQTQAILREVGELLNYNGYGTTVDDLHFHPADLYRAVSEYQSPIDFFNNSPLLTTLKHGYRKDMDEALSLPLYQNTGKKRIYFFPDQPWARRVSGVFSNLKAREQENLAHAVITKNTDNSLRISLRAPLADRRDADTICSSFPTGGGRKAAAGINSLPANMLNDFLALLDKTYA